MELLILNLQGQRTDAAEESKPPEKPKSTVNSEANSVDRKYSWNENKATGFKPKRDLVFENLLTNEELIVRLIASSDEEEVLGQALLKVDEDIEDIVGSEGELTVPLVRGSRVSGFLVFDVKLACEGGTRPPRKISRAGQGVSMAVCGRPKPKLPVVRRSLLDEDVEEVVQDFTWKFPLADTATAYDDSSPRSVGQRSRTSSPKKHGPPLETTFMAAPLPRMPEDGPPRASVPLPDPSNPKWMSSKFSALIPGWTEPESVPRFGTVPHPELDIARHDTTRQPSRPAPAGPSPGPAPGPAPGPRAGISGPGPAGPSLGPGPAPAGLSGPAPAAGPGPAHVPRAALSGPGPRLSAAGFASAEGSTDSSTFAPHDRDWPDDRICASGVKTKTKKGAAKQAAEGSGSS